MTQIIITIMVSLIVFILLIVLGRWYMYFIFDVLVGRKHQALNWILQTGEVPVIWIKKDMLTKKKSNDLIIELSRNAEIPITYTHKLKKLIKYIGVTTLLSGDEERKETIHQLEIIRKDWERRGIKDEE